MERTEVILRHVLKGGICISTIELDEPMGDCGYETQVFPGERGTRHYKTRHAAIKGHMEMLKHWAAKAHHLSNERVWARKPQRGGILRSIFGKAA